MKPAFSWLKMMTIALGLFPVGTLFAKTCPPNYNWEPFGDKGAGLCTNEVHALGPFSQSMYDLCIAEGGEDGCDNNLWDKGFVKSLWGNEFCQLGSSMDESTGFCHQGNNVFGPFPTNYTERCKDFGGGSDCDTLRWGHGMLVDVMSDLGDYPKKKINIGPLPWSGKLLVVKNGREVINQNASYIDSNGNGVMDNGDSGWVAPGSTVKVAIALRALELNSSRNGIERDIIKMIVLSDNTSTNRLIDKVGGLRALTNNLKSKGFQHLIIGRKMLDSNGGVLPSCQEMGRNGNCASGINLIETLQEVMGEKSRFNVSSQNKNWLKNVLTAVPRDHGFNSPDTLCRFVKLPGIQKCGISPFAPQNWSNLAYFPQYKAYVWIRVVPPAGTSKTKIVNTIDSLVKKALKATQNL